LARRLAIELVVTGTQQASQTLNTFLGRTAAELRILEKQQLAMQKAAVNFQKGLFPQQGQNGTGLQLGQVRTQLLATANTIKVLNQATITLADGTEILGTKTQDYTGNLNAVLAAQKAYAAALQSAERQAQATGTSITSLTNKYRALRDVQSQIIGKSLRQIGTAQGVLNTPNPTIPGLQADVYSTGRRVADARTRFAAGSISQTQLDIANALHAQATTALAEEVKKDTARRSRASTLLNGATANLTAAVAEEARLSQKQARETRLLERSVARRVSGIIMAGEREVDAAYRATPPLPSSLATISRESPALLRKLQQSGLGQNQQGVGARFGTDDFTKNLIGQGAYESINVQRDLVRQVTRVSGSFRDNTQTLQTFNAEYDKSGRVITRFGSNLSGISNVLNQLGRDFQKVIEFAIATTLVFGSFQYALRELDTIKELDKSIRQLAITANLTREQSYGLFEDIADIAIATATPLKELVKATDDIALATKRAGQSTSEWQEDILSLTQSVGILTNLAGIDTVEATDQLVSTMKQLGLQADDLPGILNKITAVAGGQSNAISDIIKGLGVMAEAGQQAGLSIDQMIATIQTLSQVTSKSPSEVATALKNLVGSIDGPAGTKALEKYNIALRDSAGNLRNIIDIYSEISDKIDKGLIPEADVKGLVKAIAGGPRRAPDAAALLSAVGDINQVSVRSINATNEALIANAKILDTAAAKFTQLQAAVDKFAASKFADVLNDSAGALADVLTKVLNVLEEIPTAVYLGVIQFGLLAAAVKFGISVGGFFIAQLRTMGSSLLALSGSLKVATVAQQQFNSASANAPFYGTTKGGGGGTPTSRLSRLNAFKGPAIVGAAGAGISAASGADPSGIIGTGLLTAGFAALALPEPTISKALAAALITAGFAVQLFGGQTKQATKEVQNNSESILNAIDGYKNISAEVKTLTDKQATLDQSIANTTNKDQLINFQNDYAENAAKLVTANQALTDSFVNLNSVLENSDFSTFAVQAAKAGAYSTEQLKELTQQIAPKILAATNPNFVAPDDFLDRNPALGGFASTTGSNIATFPEKAGPIATRKPFDLQQLETDAKAVLHLFSATGDALTATFDPTYENLQLIDVALREIKGDLDPAQYTKLQQTFQGYASSVNALFGAERNVAIYKAYLEAGGATGLFTQEDIKNGNAILDIYQTFIDLIPKGVSAGNKGTSSLAGGTAADVSQQLLDKAQAFAFDENGDPRLSLAKDAAIEFGTILLKNAGSFDDLEEKGIVLKTIANLFKEAGIEVIGLTDNIEIMGAAMSESLLQFQEDLGELNQTTLTETSAKLADLQARFQGGEFKDNEGAYKQQVDQLIAIQETVGKVTEAYDKLTETIPNFDKEIQALAGSLTNINGLQDAQFLSAGQLIERLFSLAETYGLTGDQVIALGEKLITLGAVFASLPKYTKLVVELEARSVTTDSFDRGSVDRELGNARDALKDAQAAIAKSLSDFLKNLFKSGKGTSFTSPSKGGSSASKTPQGPDVSTLDLPDEIANASNRSALIAEAVRRAKLLQSQIPGATKEAKNDIVELLKGTQRILEVKGVKDDLLRKALEELAEIEKKRLEFETKADTIRRIRVGAGTFAAIANVPVNAQTGVSLGGAQGPVNITLNLNGTVLTPAQFSQFADLIAASLKRQIANG
jgi:TP901 family phage tail tape measure protein